MGQVRGWKPGGVGGLRQGARTLPAGEVQGGGSEKVPVPGSIHHPWRTEVSRGPARGLPEQLYSWPVSGFVIYYTRPKESTLGFMVGVQPTWAAQKQTRKSRPRTGQEEKRKRVTFLLPASLKRRTHTTTDLLRDPNL